jgi:phospholipase C
VSTPTTAATAASTTDASTTTVELELTPTCGARLAPPAKYDHIVWIWMENHSFAQVMGQADSPYVNSLAAECTTMSNYRQVGSPSLPNYIGATSGDTWGITDDAGPDTHVLTADNIFRQVRSAGGTAVSYQEAMPQPCATESSGTYAVKHNPAAYYQGADDRAACQRDNLPLDRFRPDDLPTFAFVTPDLCNDTHDCPVSTGDQWLSNFVPPLLASNTYRQGRTAVFVVWDEDSPMPFLAILQTAAAGGVITDEVDHYSLLRTTEEMLGLPLLGHAADATSMRGAFATTG